MCKECWDQANNELVAENQAVLDKETKQAHDKTLVFEDMTDLGNARRLVALHGHELHYNHAMQKWLIWDDRRWQADETGEVNRRAHNVIVRYSQLLETERADLYSKKDRTNPESFSKTMQSRRAIESMVVLAQSLNPIPIRRTELDSNPFLLTVENGTIDLRTGDLQPHSQGDLITMLAPVTFTPYATSGVWDKFLQRIVPDLDVRLFLQEALGSSLTGCLPDHIFFLYGPTKTGKGTMLRAIGATLGDYAHTARYQSFIRDKYESGSQHREDLVAMVNKRFIMATEVQEGRAMAEALVKSLTGRDRQRARTLRQESFEFEPTFKIWIGTNFLLKVSAEDDAMWERLVQIPFEQQIPIDERDKTLDDQLKDEHCKSAILAWLVDGCLRWLNRGQTFVVPEVIKQAIQKYKDEMDPLKDFIDDNCDTDKPNAWELASTLYGAYKEYVETRNEYPISQQRFGRILSAKGFRPDKTVAGRIWQGIRLRLVMESSDSSKPKVDGNWPKTSEPKTGTESGTKGSTSSESEGNAKEDEEEDEEDIRDQGSKDDDE